MLAFSFPLLAQQSALYVHAASSVLLLQCKYPKGCNLYTGLSRDLGVHSPQRSSLVSGLCQLLSQGLGEAGQTAAGMVLAVHSSQLLQDGKESSDLSAAVSRAVYSRGGCGHVRVCVAA